MTKIVDAETKPRYVAGCVKEWIELEYFKREIRGIPRLKPAGLRDRLDAHMKRAKRASAPAIVEADSVAESQGD